MTQQEQLSALYEIRSIMDRSSRFVSLSGFSGILIGIFAMAGTGAAQWYLHTQHLAYRDLYHQPSLDTIDALMLMAIPATVFLLAMASVLFLSSLKAKKMHQPLWHRQGQRMMTNLCIPLAAGGFFCLALLYHGIVYLIVPAMLIFYGLSLINSSKYTFKDIRYLGILEICIGLLSSYWIDYGLLFWGLGFGVLHIVYGIILYYKYEKT